MAESDKELVGRELDAAVADRVLGREVVWARVVPITSYGSIVDHKYEASDGKGFDDVRVFPSEIGSCLASFDESSDCVPNYSEDIAAAMEVVERFFDVILGGGIKAFDCSRGANGWQVHIAGHLAGTAETPWSVDRFLEGNAKNETSLPTAICRAALAAMESVKGEQS